MEVGYLRHWPDDAMLEGDSLDYGIDETELGALEVEERLDGRIAEVSVYQEDLLACQGV